MGGLIYAVIVAMWAAYLIPLLLRRHDEMSESRSVDRFSRAMRVLSRRSPRPSRSVGVPATRTEVEATGLARAPTPPAGAGLAVRRRQQARRRRLLLSLFALTLVSAALAALTLVPSWTPLVLCLLVVCYTVHLRARARRAQERDRRRESLHERVAGRARRVDSAERVVHARRLREQERAAAESAQAAAGPKNPPVAAPPVPGPDGRAESAGLPGEAWEPVPLTLPTYVTKPRAPVIQRVIDLTRPGAWSARHGHGAAPSEVAEPEVEFAAVAAGPASTEAPVDPCDQRAATTELAAEEPFDAQGEGGDWDRRAVND